MIKVAYLLEDTSLCGGVKVVFEHARLLSRGGIPVTIIAKGGEPGRFDLGNVAFIRADKGLAAMTDSLLQFDLVIATFFRQIIELAETPVNLVHFSQGYEGDSLYWDSEIDEIKRAYALPIPKFTVSKRVSTVVKERFSQTPLYVPQGIDLSLLYPRERVKEITRVLIVGIWENAIKGIRDAVEGFLTARKMIDYLKVVRVSSLPLSDEEKSFYEPDEYYTAVPPFDMGKIYRQCDLAIVPSLEGEGFGLPAIEAMACGLPVILTRIHSFLTFHNTKDYAYFVSPRSPAGIAEGIVNLCRRPDLAEKLAMKARRVAEGYPIERTAGALIEVITGLAGRRRQERSEAITFIYFERPQGEMQTSSEVNLLGKLSKETFSDDRPITSVLAEDPLKATVGEILALSDNPFVAISLDDTLYYARNWTAPLIDALGSEFELASPVSSESFDIGLPYYSPLTFNDVAARLQKRHGGECRKDLPVPPLAFLIKRESLAGLNPETPLSELPKKLTSALVPSSLVHRFGDYYSSAREDILPYIPYGVKTVLDIGCARGFFGEMVRRERDCRVYGVELQRDIAGEARGRLDDVFCADIESAELPFHQDIDVIVFADLLEHLYDPWSILERAHRWLSPDGIIIASIPNTAHYSVILDLLRGRWDYIPFGLLCVSHIRFFTKATIEEMFTKGGYSIVTIDPQPFPQHLKGWLLEMLSEKLRVENLDGEILHPGYYVVAKRSV